VWDIEQHRATFFNRFLDFMRNRPKLTSSRNNHMENLMSNEEPNATPCADCAACEDNLSCPLAYVGNCMAFTPTPEAK
jgi:hypothetical protein